MVEHRPGQEITVSYWLVQDQDTVREYYRPLIDSTGFHVFGSKLLVLPDHFYPLKNSTPLLEIDWTAFPQGYLLQNSFAHQPRRQRIRVLQEQLSNSIFIGGQWRLHTFKVMEKPVYFAIRGDWGKMPEDSLVQMLEKTVNVQRAFWNDYNTPLFTVVLTPVYGVWTENSKSCSCTGTGLTNSFSAGATNNPCMDDLVVLTYVFNHEMMHHWIGLDIRNKTEELQYWFSEGFTDYYTYKNMLRSGIYSTKDFVDTWNMEVFEKHYKSQNKTTPNYKIKEAFWTDPDISKLPYRRGEIFAFYLDNQIQIHSAGEKSLDNLMFDLLAHSRKENRPWTNEDFLDLCAKYLDEDLSAFFEQHIIVGEPIDFEKIELAKHWTVEVKEGIPVLGIGRE
ncbi:MAG: peptidase [Lewinellaceae bacterium]|nr:peptidase [Lewinellaceae bacterium]